MKTSASALPQLGLPTRWGRGTGRSDRRIRVPEPAAAATNGRNHRRRRDGFVLTITPLMQNVLSITSSFVLRSVSIECELTGRRPRTDRIRDLFLGNPAHNAPRRWGFFRVTHVLPGGVTVSGQALVCASADSAHPSIRSTLQAYRGGVRVLKPCQTSRRIQLLQGTLFTTKLIFFLCPLSAIEFSQKPML